MDRKKLSDKDIVFIREEARMLRLINATSDMVIKIYDFFETPEFFHMVLEYLPGGDCR